MVNTTMSYRITVEPLGQSFDCAEGQTLLDAALRSGIHLPHACGHGLCGTCKVQVTDGEIEHGDASSFALMDLERDEGKCLACCATPQADLVIEADVDEEPDARQIALRDFIGRVIGLDDLTPTIKRIRLALDPAGPGLDFQAGQYVHLHLPTGAPGSDAPRAFSLANPPGPAEQGTHEVELHVRLVPGGQATPWLHQQLQVGDTLTVSGPLGRFFVRKSDPKPLLFMAGGSGLSSPHAMILDLLCTDSDARPITLVYGARHRAELYYHERFLALAGQFPNFRYQPALSEPSSACGWAGATGFVHEAAARLFDGDFRGQRAYLCGPPPMIEACIRTLMQGRLFERDIYTEKFVTAEDGQQALARSPLFRRL
jgi:phenol hydroxylase P5 protein